MLSKYLRRVYDTMRSQIVSGAQVKLELSELLAIEGVALRSIASGRQYLFCSTKIPIVERDAMRMERMTGRYIILLHHDR